MPTVDIYNADGKVVGNMDLNENVFGVDVRTDVMHEVVVNYLANQRQGTQSTKTRTEVRGGGIKPWRQRVQAAQDRVVSELRSGLAVVLHSARSPETTDTH